MILAGDSSGCDHGQREKIVKVVSVHDRSARGYCIARTVTGHYLRLLRFDKSARSSRDGRPKATGRWRVSVGLLLFVRPA